MIFFEQMINILQKHAIWCQCVTIFHVAITLACISSFQNITKGPDIFWSTVCIINTIVLFVEAEHAPIVFTTDTWQTINNYREKIIWAVFATFNGPKNPLIYQCFAILLIFICFQKLPFLWSSLHLWDLILLGQLVRETTLLYLCLCNIPKTSAVSFGHKSVYCGDNP